MRVYGGGMGPQQDHAHGDRTTRAGTCEVESPVTAALCWPDLTFDRATVAALALPAYRWTPGGELWEFEDGAFWVAAPRHRKRQRVDDESLAPADGWSHPADCDCPACRVMEP